MSEKSKQADIPFPLSHIAKYGDVMFVCSRFPRSYLSAEMDALVMWVMHTGVGSVDYTVTGISKRDGGHYLAGDPREGGKRLTISAQSSRPILAYGKAMFVVICSRSRGEVLLVTKINPPQTFRMDSIARGDTSSLPSFCVDYNANHEENVAIPSYCPRPPDEPRWRAVAQSGGRQSGKSLVQRLRECEEELIERVGFDDFAAHLEDVDAKNKEIREELDAISSDIARLQRNQVNTKESDLRNAVVEEARRLKESCGGTHPDIPPIPGEEPHISTIRALWRAISTLDAHLAKNKDPK